MPFAPGDLVHIATFGRGVVREQRNGDRYLIEVKGRTMLVEAGQLTRLDQPRPTSRRDPSPPDGVPEHLTRTHAPDVVDLHGMTVEEALATLETLLNDAILAGHGELRVIHGRGGGRLKDAVHRWLRLVPAVRGFRLDAANPGVTIVGL
jgi:DNA mismatch repair protein MutS2